MQLKTQVYIILGFLFLTFSINCFGLTSKYRIIIRDDPSTTMCIGWNQDMGNNPVVYFGEEDLGRDFNRYPNSKKPDRETNYKSLHSVFARLTDLKPATKYYFVIKDSDGSSERFWFETLPSNPDVPLSIVMGGDSRRTKITGSKSWDPRVKTNRMIQKIKPHFIAFGGDFTMMDSEKQWLTWFNDWQHTIDSSGRMTPIMPARGNHEQSNQAVYQLFDVSSENIVYALNFGGSLLRFYTLNSLDPVAGSDQTNWLKNDLAQHKGKETWRFVQYHYPIVPHQSHKKVKIDQYTNWAPLFKEYRVQVVVECDAHVVKITHPIVPSAEGESGFIRDDQNGTTYLGEGSWGLKRNADLSYKWTLASGSFYQFKWVILTQKKAEVRTVITENPEEVEEINLDNRTELPKGLKIWEIKGKNEIILSP